MIGKLRYVLLTTILICGFLFGKSVFLPRNNPKEVNAYAKAVNSVKDFKVIKAMNELKPGEIGSITIQGRPGIKYTITAAYSLGRDFIEAVQERTADEFGQATFLWTVSKKTIPGTYLVTITGDGKTINFNHTVIK